ncbi:MAG: dephospho-CoA kinase [Prevotellaceae bacterium]|jgi:dephospho-CoA kinase|nr:dephospho-CoA kinase [Prevotellaceae bacterium]
MLKIGLTGGIGSGKSIVCRIFAALGIPVYQADLAAKNLYDTDKDLQNKLKLLWGQDLYDSEGKLNRRKLAEIIFSNAENLNKINSLVHPAVINDFHRYLLALPSGVPYVIHEAAILYEAKMENLFDVIINVWAPENVKIERALARGTTNITQRIKAQLSDKIKIKLSDYNILNDDTTLVLPQVLEIHRKLIIN